jgi:hypothetical protein
VYPSTSQSIFHNVEAAQEHARTAKCVFLDNVSATWSINPIPQESLVVLELEALEDVCLEGKIKRRQQMETLGVQAVMDQMVVMPVTAKMPTLLKETKIPVARMAMTPLVKTATHPVTATDRMAMAQEKEETHPMEVMRLQLGQRGLLAMLDDRAETQHLVGSQHLVESQETAQTEHLLTKVSLDRIPVQVMTAKTEMASQAKMVPMTAALVALRIRMEKIPAQALLHQFVLQHVLETQSASTGSAQQSETLLPVENHPTVSCACFADKLHRLVIQALLASTTSASLLMDRWTVVPQEQTVQLTMLASRTLV